MGSGGSVGVVLTGTGYLAARHRCPPDAGLCPEARAGLWCQAGCLRGARRPSGGGACFSGGSALAAGVGDRVDQGGGDGEQALGAAQEAQVVGGGGAEGDPGGGGLGQCPGGLGGACGHARALAHELDGDVADLEAGLAHPAGGLAQERSPGGSLPLGLGGAEVRAQVAQPGGREQGVAAGVGDDVAVGVTGQAHLTGPLQAGQVHGGARVGGGEGVHVGADAGARQELGDLVQGDRGRAGGVAGPGRCRGL